MKGGSKQSKRKTERHCGIDFIKKKKKLEPSQEEQAE